MTNSLYFEAFYSPKTQKSPCRTSKSVKTPSFNDAMKSAARPLLLPVKKMWPNQSSCYTLWDLFVPQCSTTLKTGLNMSQWWSKLVSCCRLPRCKPRRDSRSGWPCPSGWKTPGLRWRPPWPRRLHTMLQTVPVVSISDMVSNSVVDTIIIYNYI